MSGSPGPESPVPGQRRGAYRRWLFRGVLTATACLGLWLGFERLLGWHLLTQWRADKLRNAEPLQAEQLIPAEVPASDDALEQLLTHSDRVASAIKAVGELLPSRKQLFQSGMMAAPMKLESWESEEGNTHRWSDVLDGLSEDTNLWATLHSALEKPGFKFGTVYTNGFEELKTRELVPLKGCANFLRIHTLADLRAANTDRALLALLDLLEICRRVEKEPLLIHQLVRLACLEMAYFCTWAGISSGQWKEPELFKLNGAWSQLNAVQAMERAVLMERAMFITHYHLLRADRQKLIKNLDGMEVFFGLEADGASVTARWTRSIQATAWIGVWHSQDCVRALKRLDYVVSAVRSASTTSWLSIETNLPPDLRESSDHWTGLGMTPSIQGWTRFRFPISSAGTFLHGSVIQRALHGDCLRELVLAGIAIHRSLLAGSPLPERIESLVPRWLASIPQDRLGGGALRYRRDGPTGFVLYSVGKDGRDDGGVEAVESTDLIWPSPASRDE